jgi:nitrite reductase/ring-hydroxylating ferredoxin subunit
VGARRVCRIEDLPPGEMRIVPGGRWGIGLFNRGGSVYALNNYCPHAGAPVCHGAVTGTTESDKSYDSRWVREGDILRCPWHGWEFDLSTGKSVAEPVRRVKTFRVSLEEGWIVIHD